MISVFERMDAAMLKYGIYAKAVELSGRADAVLTLAPRYENAAMILDMRGLRDACNAPLFQLSLDNDWDETAWSRLRSFLYYC